MDSHKLIKGVRAFWMDASEGKQIGKAVVGFNRMREVVDALVKEEGMIAADSLKLLTSMAMSPALIGVRWSPF